MASQKRILVIDDDWLILLSVREVFEMLDYRTFILDRSHNVPAAVLAIQPDIIIIDVMMPGKDGYIVIGELEDLGYKIPLIIMTGLSIAEHSLGGHALVAKGEFNTTDDLVAMVEKILGNRTN